MRRQELLNELDNAITLFEQREAINQEYAKVKKKDRPYRDEVGMGGLTIIFLCFEIYGFGMYVLGLVAGIIMKDEELIKNAGVGAMFFAALIVTTYLFSHLSCLIENKQIRKDNAKLRVQKVAIEKEKKVLEEKYDAVQNKINYHLGNWYPEGYEKSYIASFFYQVIANGRASGLGEAINLYEEECYRRRQMKENEHIRRELERHNFKQNVQIVQSAAETAALSAQLANANKQLAEMKKELSELKRNDTRRR